MASYLDRLARRVVRADSVQSAMSGLGVAGADKAVDARPANPTWLDYQQADSLSVVDGMIRRLIWGIPEDTVGDGWRVDVGEDTDVYAEFDERTNLEDIAQDVDATARQYGGAWVWMVCRGVKDFAEPLPPGKEIEALHVLSAPEVHAIRWEDSIKSRYWSRPERVSISPIRPGLSLTQGLNNVHRSHLVYVPGLPKTRSQYKPLLVDYDISVPQAYWECARDLGLTTRSAAVAAMEQSMLTLTLGARQTTAAGDQDTQAASALQLWSRSRSTLKANVLTGNDTLQRLPVSLQSLDSLVRVGYERFAAIEGIPLSALVGQAPAGLTSDDRSGRETYNRLLRRRRRRRYNSLLRRIYDQQFGRVEDREIVWSPLEVLDPLAEADRSERLARRDAALVQAGIITPDEARERLRGSEEMTLPVLDADADDGGLTDPIDVPALLAGDDGGE